MPNGDQGPSTEERLPPAKDVLVELALAPRAGATAGAAAPAPEARYRILRTLEVDEYDQPVPAAEIAALTQPRPAPVDNSFGGHARKAAKLSIADAPMEEFDDISDLIATFPAHNDMKALDISIDETSDRVDAEKRNVKVKAFLYAASLEDDKDFHLIIGRDPHKAAKYMTAEVSGLPPDDTDSFATLDEVRSTYLEFFGDGLPGPSYDFYDPPIPIEIEGSLFWDASHAQGGRPGPQKLRPRMPVVWEIHPLTRIVFEP
jgi:hypothetical protein